VNEEPLQTNPPPPRRTRSTLQRYGIALLSVAAAFVSTLCLQHLFPYPFLFLFFGAVMVSAWFGGTAAGLVAVLISTVVVDYFFVPPFYSFSISATSEAYFGAFIACALVASWISSSKKKSEEALKETRDQLEIRVSERTAELMKTQADLAHLSQVMSMGELAASIAHEISQPLTAVVAHGHACVEWLSASPPNVEKARQTADRIIQDGTQAGTVVSRIRALFKKETPAKSWFYMNEVIHQLTLFLRDEAMRRHITIQTDLASGLPRIMADRIQLQQVILNLAMNGMDAMAETTEDPKELVIRSRQEGEAMVVQVEDCGIGLNPETAEKMFDPFFTTKPHGTGMGLSISRSIVESHEGRLSALPRPSGGAIFQFTLPIHSHEFND
jgi:C4-dicarboxylate-specific signal transduction histidine kinase